jgi:hypothetical protein
MASTLSTRASTITASTEAAVAPKVSTTLHSSEREVRGRGRDSGDGAIHACLARSGCRAWKD